MKPIEFPQQNVVFAEGQEEYQPLPAHVDNEGVVTSCWELDEDDLKQINESGKIYVSMMTFRQHLQPISMQTENPFNDNQTQENNG